MQSVQDARIRRTKHYVLNRHAFYEQLYKEIQSFSKYYMRKGKEVAIRLNGTSDQPLVETMFSQLRRFNYNIAFYDYTKNHKKAGTRYGIDGNRYVVTFSYSEKSESETQAIEVLNRGGNVAIVFDRLPKTWNGFKVIDGDERDDLMLDHSGVILGLTAKGKAKKDSSGFVVKYTQDHMMTETFKNYLQEFNANEYLKRNQYAY